MTMKKVLIVGQNGQVTTYLQRELCKSDDIQLMVANRQTLDLAKPQMVRQSLQELKPDLIVNPAAYTAVDLAEQEQELAYLINRDSVQEIASYCAESTTPLIHFSTDYVFAGDASKPYLEDDATAPTGVYGQSKLEGEIAVIQSKAPAVVLRTAWVYSNHGKNFYKTMLALSETRDELNVVADQVGAPTYAGSIAENCRVLVERFLQNGILESEVGIYHFSCEGQTSWCDFARAIFTENSIDHMTVNAITTEEFPTPAKRPAYSVLDGNKLKQTFDISLPHWGTALAQCAVETRDS